MARYSSNFGNKLQMMVGISKEYGFTSNFDISRPFTPRRMELPDEIGTRRDWVAELWKKKDEENMFRKQHFLFQKSKIT